MKARSTSFFIMAAAFLVSSLLWFFWSKNVAAGIVWLSVGILELVIGLILRAKEKKTK